MGTRNLICVFYKGKFVIAQYTQWDGYPEGQGSQIWAFLSIPANIERLQIGLEHIHILQATEKLDEEIERLNKVRREIVFFPGNLELLKKGEFVSQIEKSGYEMSPAEKDRFEDWKGKILKGMSMEGIDRSNWDIDGSNGLKLYWPSISRDTGADILETVASSSAENPTLINLNLEFALDGVFCEWAYVIDLDSSKLEVFGGSIPKTLSHNTRFNDAEPSENSRSSERLKKEERTVPCFLKSFDFDEIPVTDSEEFVRLVGKAKGRSD